MGGKTRTHPGSHRDGRPGGRVAPLLPVSPLAAWLLLVCW
jgi:hypothetical protein